LTGLTHLHVEPTNKVTKLQFWKEYLIQKLGSIQSINGNLITSKELKRAEILFGNYFETQNQLPIYRQNCEIKENNSDNRFGILLTECQQLETRRRRVKTVAPQVWLSIIRDVTAQILDHNWDSYCFATQQNKT
jgi:hypothetical protein